jgi:hypothetical protein
MAPMRGDGGRCAVQIGGQVSTPLDADAAFPSGLVAAGRLSVFLGSVEVESAITADVNFPSC